MVRVFCGFYGKYAVNENMKAADTKKSCASMGGIVGCCLSILACKGEREEQGGAGRGGASCNWFIANLGLLQTKIRPAAPTGSRLTFGCGGPECSTAGYR